MDEELSAQREADALNRRAEQAKQNAEWLAVRAARWQAGADGERAVAAALAPLTRNDETAVVLHDRLLSPGQSRVNLDHIVVTRAGVFLIDAKNWSGDLSVDEYSLWQRTGTVAEGRRYSRHVELDKVTASATTMARILFGPVVPVIALANPRHQALPPVQVRGVQVLPASALRPWLEKQPPLLGPEQLDSLRIKLEALFPPATGVIATEPAAQHRVRRRPTPMARPPMSARRTPPARDRRRRRATAVKRIALLAATFLFVANLGMIATAAGGLLSRVITSSIPVTGSTASPSSARAGGQPTSAASTSAATVAALTLMDGSPAPPKACQGVSSQDVEQVWGHTVTEHSYGNDKNHCGWHLTPPSGPYVPADITITTGFPARIATQSMTSAAVTARFGTATISVPQHSPVPGSPVAAANITQPIQVSYRYTYTAKPTAASIAATDKDAEVRVTQLAQRLATRLPQGTGADNTTLSLS